MWVSSKEFRKALGLSCQALYNRRIKNTVKHQKVNGVYVFWLEKQENRQNVLYARVSNSSQKSDLDNQEKILREYMVSTGHKVDAVFTDIASGMNEDRKGLNELMDLVVQKKINKVFISYKDRLTRFGYGYFEHLFNKFGTQIEVVNATKEEDFQQELTQDLISIIHHFSMKMYSNRKKQLKDLQKQLKDDNN